MASEFEIIQALLRQQTDFFSERFDRLETRMERLETRAGAIETQTAKTNGFVGRHEADIAKLKNPDLDGPLLTQRDGVLIRKAVGYSVSIGTFLFGAWKWISTQWGS